MDFTLKQLRYFVAAAEAGSITKASREVAISQPSLSAAIAHLERSFGVQLFLRHPAQGLSLTASGRRFLSSARRLLDHAHEVAADAGGLGEAMQGPLEIGCFQTFAPLFLPRLLKDFGARHPETEVSFREGTLDVLQDQVLSGVLELALLYDLDLSDRLETETLAGLPPHVLLPEGHPLARRRVVSLEQLATEPMVLLDLPHSREYFRSLFLSVGAEPLVRHRTESVEMLRGLVANGHGYALLNLRPTTARSYDGRPIVTRPLAERLPPLPIVLGRARGARLSRRAESFAAFCRDFFAAVADRYAQPSAAARAPRRVAEQAAQSR